MVFPFRYNSFLFKLCNHVSYHVRILGHSTQSTADIETLCDDYFLKALRTRNSGLLVTRNMTAGVQPP